MNKSKKVGQSEAQSLCRMASSLRRLSLIISKY